MTTSTGPGTGLSAPPREGAGATPRLGDRTVFYRPARAYTRPLPRDEVLLAAPPSVAQASAVGGVLQILLPLLTSVGSLGYILVLSGSNRSPLLYVALGGMVVASILAGVLMRWQQKRASRKGKARERSRYRAYLDDVGRDLEGVAAAQRAVADQLCPDLPTLWSRARRRERLWERRPHDDDFLTVRVGLGPVALSSPVRLDLGSGPLVEYDPELLEAAKSVVDQRGVLTAAPVTVPLRRLGVVALTGPREQAHALARAILVQLAAFHAPEDLRLLAAFPSSSLAAWDWLKWLPHNREQSGGPAPPGTAAPPACLLAEGSEQLAALLDQEIRPRLTRMDREPRPGEDAGGGEDPHLVVVLDGFSPRGPFARLPLVGELLARAHAAGITVLCVGEDRADEPAELAARLELDPRGGLAIEETGLGGQRIDGIRPDHGGLSFCEALARELAPVRLGRRGAASGATAAAGGRLMELLGLGDGPVDPAVTWRPRPRPELLKVPFGVGPDGGPVVLDLKEAADSGMGPHGLIIGATGSGKSELLRTIITGLAVGHSPETLSFVLVDFKGGAAFAEFAALPHTAGMITNLQADLTMVDRMHDALVGEQERRQRMLRDAGNLDGIKQYQARRASDPSMPPMPYLLVIVDEFGELLANRPDFLDLFIAIGRVGRSLGIHLLFASQRLEEGRIRGLEGHLRYRICLRTFSASESQAVLGTPDAYYLPASPGFGIFKVDTEVYQRFRAALVAAPRPERGVTAAAVTVVPFQPTRQPAKARAKGPRSDGGQRVETDMDVAVAALAAAGRGAQAHQVWLPPLPAGLPIDRLLPDAEIPAVGPAAAGSPRGDPDVPGWLRTPFGLLDKPLEQAQEPATLDFTGAAGHLAIVGAPRTGKSTLLATIITSFALTHPPDAVQFYCIDLGGGQLHQLEALPHVGTVCGKRDRDQARRLVRVLRAMLAEREVLFRRHGVDSMTAFHRRRRQDPELAATGYGEVFLVIDNWGLLRQEFEELEYDINEMVASGLHYGFHLVLSANRWGDVRMALRDNIGGRLELRLNDPIDSEIGRKQAATIPEGAPGRGLVPAALQFEAALPRLHGVAGFDAVAERAVRAPGGAEAPPLRMLPDLVGPEALGAPAASAAPGVPFAIDEHRLELVHLDLFGGLPHFMVFGDGECGKTSLLRLLLRGFTERYQPEDVQLHVVDYRRALIDVAEGPHIAGYACTEAMVTDLVSKLKDTLAERLPSPSLTRAQLLARDWWSGPQQVVLVDDYDLLLGPMGGALGSLGDLLGQAEDIGLHVVLARAVSGTARTSYEPFFQRLRELGTPGLIMSGDPSEGPILGNHKAHPLPPGRGLLVHRQRPTGLVQVVFDPQVSQPPSARSS